MKFVLVAACFLAVCSASQSDKLEWISFAYTAPNTEVSLASKSAYVTYPGIATATAGSKVTIKLYKDKEVAHSFDVSQDDITTPNIYRFALEDATDGQYSAQLCFSGADGGVEKCSHLSSPATPMETGRTGEGAYHQLTCKRTKKDDEVVELVADLKPIENYASTTQLDQLKKIPKSVISKYSFQNNRQVKDIEGVKMAYFAITYPVKDFREFARMNDKCFRKYRPVILTYIVDKVTKKVLKYGRLSPYLPKSYYFTFLGLRECKDEVTGELEIKEPELSKIPDVPIELLVNVKDLPQGDYKVWHTACMVRKDDTDEGITHCAEPYVQDWNYTE